MKRAQTLRSLLQHTPALQELLRGADQLSALQTQLEQHLQPAARAHCRVAALQEGCLMLLVTDANWATRLRYQHNRLLKELQTVPAFQTLKTIQIKVRPQDEVVVPERERLTLSNQASRTLQETAANVSNPALRAALERLARHGLPDAEKAEKAEKKAT